MREHAPLGLMEVDQLLLLQLKPCHITNSWCGRSCSPGAARGLTAAALVDAEHVGERRSQGPSSVMSSFARISGAQVLFYVRKGVVVVVLRNWDTPGSLI